MFVILPAVTWIVLIQFIFLSSNREYKLAMVALNQFEPFTLAVPWLL